MTCSGGSVQSGANSRRGRPARLLEPVAVRLVRSSVSGMDPGTLTPTSAPSVATSGNGLIRRKWSEPDGGSKTYTKNDLSTCGDYGLRQARLRSICPRRVCSCGRALASCKTLTAMLAGAIPTRSIEEHSSTSNAEAPGVLRGPLHLHLSLPGQGPMSWGRRT